MNSRPASLEELERALPHIKQAPRDAGVIKMIVRRPRTNEREVLEEGTLDLEAGLLGDKWKERMTPDRRNQITIMNSRAIAAIAGVPEAWPLAGDQLFVDLDLSCENLPAGTQLSIGIALLQVTEQPHLGCKKFAARFGVDAAGFVNSEIGKELRLRGLNARIVQGGTVRTGDPVKISLRADV